MELGPLPCIPMPFSVRNSSRSMYCSWNRPPSHGKVLSHSRGPRNADWELGRNAADPGAPPAPAAAPAPAPPPPLLLCDSSSESGGLSLSGEKQKRVGFVHPEGGSEASLEMCPQSPFDFTCTT